MSIMNSILAAILCAVAPLSSEAAVQTKTEEVSNFKLGREIVSQIRSDYENGKYNEFLTEADQSYRKADLTGLIQMRSKGAPDNFQEGPFSDLQRQKKQALLNVISDDDDSIFAEKVRSLSADLLTPEQEKALSRLNSFISMAPNTGDSADENALIDIDLEYEYKLSTGNTQERQIALRMEKMDKMVQASKNFEDRSLKQAVGMAAATLDARLSRNLDGADLNRMTKQNKPQNAQEEIVFSILKDYQRQFSDLLSKIT